MNNFSELYIFVKSFPGLLAWVERDLAGKDKSWLLIYCCQKDGIETRIETLRDGNKNDLYSVSPCCFTTAKAGQVILNAASFKGLTRQKRVPNFQKALHDGSYAGPLLRQAPRIPTPYQKARLNSSIGAGLRQVSTQGWRHLSPSPHRSSLPRTGMPAQAGPSSACKHPAADTVLVIADTDLQAVPDTRHGNTQLSAPVLLASLFSLRSPRGRPFFTGKFYRLYLRLHPRGNKSAGTARQEQAEAEFT